MSVTSKSDAIYTLSSCSLEAVRSDEKARFPCNTLLATIDKNLCDNHPTTSVLERVDVRHWWPTPFGRGAPSAVKLILGLRES